MPEYGRSMRRIARVIAWGVVGAAVAGALIGGSFGIAGTSLTQPASAVRVVGPPLRADVPDRHEPDRTPAPDVTGPSDLPSSAGEPPTPSATAISAPTSGVPTSAEDGGPERGDD